MTDAPHKKYRSLGPYSPPNPSEAEEERNQPMAVASDIASPHDAFMPTTASLDAYDERVGGVPREKMVARSRAENRAAEDPPGYTDVDRRGYRHLRDEGEQQEEDERARQGARGSAGDDEPRE